VEIRLLKLLDGASRARGTAVVIDVFRAFSTACVVAARGAARIWPVERVEEAFRLKRSHPDVVLVGERGGKMIEGFDHGNSPSKLSGLDFTGRSVVLTTSAGTRGLFQATAADEVVTGSFLNAGAVVEHLRQQRPDVVSVVALGSRGEVETTEDTLCGEYLRDRILGKPVDFDAIQAEIRAAPSGRKFLDPERPWFPPPDLELCLDVDRYGFVLRLADVEDGPPQLVRVAIDRDGSVNSR
jgi:2-phosphosulfolactate phosphatase